MPSDSEVDLDEILKVDPFGELSRKERKMLLLMSVIAIAVSKAGLVPTKIVGFGIEFSQIDSPAILWLLVAAVLYFLVTFLAYALPDFLIWQVRYNKFWYTLAKEHEENREKYGPGYDEDYSERPSPSEDFVKMWGNYSQARARFKKLALTKITLDLAVPVLVGIVAILFTAVAAWCQAGAKIP